MEEKAHLNDFGRRVLSVGLDLVTSPDKKYPDLWRAWRKGRRRRESDKKATVVLLVFIMATFDGIGLTIRR